jgi:hypothetical protein
MNEGILEEWNAGILGLNAKRNFLRIADHSRIEF